MAATYLRDILKLKGKVYLLGMEGMEEELQKAGLEFIGQGVWDKHKVTDPHLVTK